VNYFRIVTLSTPLIFIGLIIYGWIRWKKLPTWLKGGLIGITAYWFLFFVLYALVLLLDWDPNFMYVLAFPFVPFYHLFQSLNLSEGYLLVGGTFIGSPLFFGLVGILIGLSLNRVKKRSASQAKRKPEAEG
jgi:hypothetical protein